MRSDFSVLTGNPARRKLVVVSTDPSITAPSPGSAGDPTGGGGFLEVLNPTTGATDTFALPAANWKGSGIPPGSKGYKYTDRGLTAGPCKTAKIKDGRLDARCQGAQISFTLDEPSQGSLGLRRTLGTAAKSKVARVLPAGSSDSRKWRAMRR